MRLYILGAFIAASWIFVIYGILTCPEVKDDEKPSFFNEEDNTSDSIDTTVTTE